jgi:PhzF family phenazine biosynthesis protein
MPLFAFRQLDVFSARAGKGNPLAVVHEAQGLDDAAMQGFAAWTNLSETVFLFPPVHPEADYLLRIFTPVSELPFAGHPTLGACHAWLEEGGVPQGREIIQECGVGLVRIRRDGALLDSGLLDSGRLAFAAPVLAQEDVPVADFSRLAAALGIPVGRILAARRLSSLPPRWIGVLLASRDEVLSVQVNRAALGEMDIGVVAPWPGGDADFEVRAFSPEIATEDPVTGSLNAGLARWLIGASIAPPRYVASQGTCLGREGRVHVEYDGTDFWIGGDSVTCIKGTLTL